MAKIKTCDLYKRLFKIPNTLLRVQATFHCRLWLRRTFKSGSRDFLPYPRINVALNHVPAVGLLVALTTVIGQ